MGLAQDQAALAAALTGQGPIPAGMDGRRFTAAREALLRKRAGLVRRSWPALAQHLEPHFLQDFAAWAQGRGAAGGFVDGWLFARSLDPTSLSGAAQFELATREATLTLNGGTVSPRRIPHVVTTQQIVVIGWRGRTWLRRR